MAIKKVSVLDTGFFKLDGGAMFGVTPKSMWNKLNPADENNMTVWAMRSLYIETDSKKILIDTGLGNVLDPKFAAYFFPFGDDSLMSSLQKINVKAEEITDVLLSHLHFDHTGGSLVRNNEGNLIPAFPNATYWTHKKHFDFAVNPNAREKNSFIKETFLPLQYLRKFKFFELENEIFDGVLHTITTYGHTHAMTSFVFTFSGKNFYYAADVFPSEWHINLPNVMAYDMQPNQTLIEKEIILNAAIEQNWYFIFEHDPKTECATIAKNDKGKYIIAERFKLDELILP